VASVSWSLGVTFSVDVTVPPGCTAEVVLPGGPSHEVGPGEHHVETARR
jgi:alpha-L-rhamnosidase